MMFDCFEYACVFVCLLMNVISWVKYIFVRTTHFVARFSGKWGALIALWLHLFAHVLRFVWVETDFDGD